MWDEESVVRYENWFASPAGQYAFHMERRLLDQLLSVWPRRGQKLLEIGCGPGFFLEAFYEAGFQVTGLDLSPAMLESSRKRLGNRVDLHLGHAEHMPFRDKEFDFAVLLTVLEFCQDPEKVLLEARRVARHGLIIGFLNLASCYYLSRGLFRKSGTLREACWKTSFEMHRLIREAYGPLKTRTYSVLPGPMSTWRDTVPWKWMNGLVYPFALGSYIGVRVEFGRERLMTPLLLLKREAKLTS